ncbi:MAG: hypothetical protein H7244_14545 [Herminiimonas sp.]|nr:hypothetical protein [Herminiimonas sp.]
MSAQNIEAGIPILTEVLDEPIDGVDLPERRKTPHVASGVPAETQPHSMETPVPAPVPVQATLGSAGIDDFDRVEREVSERVLQQLLGQVDLVLEQRIRDSLADVLQSAVDSLASDLRQGLKQTLEDALAQAIAHEMKNLRNAKIQNMR